MTLTPLYVLLCSLILIFLYRPITSTNVFNPTSTKGFGAGPARILLLTAHPDDECMFFAPTITALVAETNFIVGEPKNAQVRPPIELSFLCLSIGDADGLGETRRQELNSSLDVLGIHPDRRWVLDHPDLKDNFTSQWAPEVISHVIQPYILKHKINTVITFDYEGISSHPNHKSLPYGVKHLRESQDLPLRLLALITVPVVQKYSSFLAPILSKFDIYASLLLEQTKKRFQFLPTSLPIRNNEELVFVSGIPDYVNALRAMCSHWSQLLWFRWLYISFSRYMWVNEWIEL